MQPTVTDLLQKYLPLPSVEPIRQLIDKYNVTLTITRDRKSKRGDFRPGMNGRRHHITVNGSLNKYEFLFVALHEMAHVHVFKKHSRRAAPHGKEWKETYGAFIRDAVDKSLFDTTLNSLLYNYSFNVNATGPSDPELVRAFKDFDLQPDAHSWSLLEELPNGAIFEARNKRLFIKDEKIRKRYLCRCVQTGRKYVFNPVAQVKIMMKPGDG